MLKDYNNILITGGCGFIGSNFLNYMLNKYPDSKFFNIDKLDYCSNVHNVNVMPNYYFIKGDITNYEFIKKFIEMNSIDLVIHFAAQSHVDNSFNSSLDFTNDNIVGTHTLLECFRRYGMNTLQLFIHISTDEVYGEVDLENPGCLEETRLNPTNPYAATKAAAEMLVKSYYYSYKMPLIIVRGNNVYGLNQYPEKLIPKFIKLLLSNQKMTIQGKGDTRRNFIHAMDVARALEIIICKGIIGEVYNIGTDQELSVSEIAAKLCSIIHPDTNINDWIVYVPDRPFNDFRYSVNTTKLRNLGWSETENLDNALHEIIISLKNT